MAQCPECKSELKFVTRDSIAGCVCEEQIDCPKCGMVGYWAYGSYDPHYPYQGADFPSVIHPWSPQ